MTSIKDILDSLSPADRSVLNYAFEFELSQMIRLKDGLYVGVNLDREKLNLDEKLVAGVWSYGQLRN